jgi:hypothetical protein
MLYNLKELENNKIILCHKCKGYRHIFIPTQHPYNYKKEICNICNGKGLVKIKIEKIKEITLHDKLSVLGEYNNYQKVGPQEQEYLEEYGKWLEDNNYEVVKINRD